MRRWLNIPVLAVALAGCGGGSAASEAPNPLFADVVFEGGADEGALEALLAVDTKADPQRGAAIDSPATNSLLAASMVSTFTWHLRDAAPPNDTGYFLLFSTDATPRLLRVFTTKQSYTPDAKAWATLSSVGEWTKLSIFSASFFGDRLVGGGPWKGDSIEFCIEKR